MNKTLNCIVCPIGCEITSEFCIVTGTVESVSGALCERGKSYARQEILAPQRTIQTSVKVVGGELPLASVKTSGSVPKERLFDIMVAIKALTVDAPVAIGDVVCKNILELGVDIVVTKPVSRTSDS